MQQRISVVISFGAGVLFAGTSLGFGEEGPDSVGLECRVQMPSIQGNESGYRTVRMPSPHKHQVPLRTRVGPSRQSAGIIVIEAGTGMPRSFLWS
jgi:hypothetical protein